MKNLKGKHLYAPSLEAMVKSPHDSIVTMPRLVLPYQTQTKLSVLRVQTNYQQPNPFATQTLVPQVNIYTHIKRLLPDLNSLNYKGSLT